MKQNLPVNYLKKKAKTQTINAKKYGIKTNLINIYMKIYKGFLFTFYNSKNLIYLF